MRLLLSVSLTLLLSFNSLEANEIRLEEHYKISKTFSGEINNNQTFHVIIAKNKESKKHEIIPVSFFNNALTRLKSVSFDKSPSIISYHSNKKNIVTLLVSTGTSYPINKYVLDINMASGETNLSELITDIDVKATLQKKDKQIMITRKWNDIFIYNIKNANSISLTKVSKTKKTASIFKGINSSNFGAVNTNEFVANGPTSSFKIYCEKDNLFFSKDYLRYRQTAVLKVSIENNGDLIEQNLNENLYKYDKFRLVKESSSFVHNNRLYQLLLGEKSGYINISDFNTNERNSISLLDAEVSMSSEGFTNMNNFLREATKGKYVTTITVNESIDENHIIVRCDYVLPDTYGYNYNWWWHHQNFIWQQQMHMNNLPSFGPSQPTDDYFYEIFKDNKKKYFELVLNKDTFKVSNRSIKPKYIEINKREYSDKVYNVDTFKYVSSVFLEEQFVYFYKDVLSNAFRISHKSLNDD